MDVMYARDGVTANDLCTALPDGPSNATVRTLLRILEEKGQLTHRDEGGRFVYSPVQPRESAARQALDRLVDTFFRGSAAETVAALLRDDRERLTPEEIDRLQALIDQARTEG